MLRTPWDVTGRSWDAPGAPLPTAGDVDHCLWDELVINSGISVFISLTDLQPQGLDTPTSHARSEFVVGVSTPPCLHFNVKVQDTGKWLDPPVAVPNPAAAGDDRPALVRDLKKCIVSSMAL
eukprot:2219052-Pyramimonas_sp.AAC.1